MEFRLLGRLEVDEGGRLLRFRGRNERALLVYLLLHEGELVSRERLVEAVWRGRPPPSATHSLEACVSSLRKQLGERSIESGPGGYLLRVPPEQLDLRRFEQLVERGWRELAAGRAADADDPFRQALALWRGEPFPELADDRNAELERQRLEELRLQALEGQMDAQLALGRQAELVGRLQPLVARYPLREGLARRLMLSLYRSGRQAEALEVYQQTRHRLVDELGIEPGSELQQLQQAILAHAPELDLQPLGDGHSEAGVSAQAAPVGRTPRQSTFRAPRRRGKVVGVAVLALLALAVAAVWALSLRGNGGKASLTGAPKVGATSASWEIAADTKLKRDHYGAIAIVADEVTLDCGGHRVIPAAGSTAAGIEIRNHRGVTVTNCVVGPGFKMGIALFAAHRNTVRGNTSAGNENDFGFGDGSSGNTLAANTASGGVHGFFLVNATSNVIRKNTVSETQVGFQLNRGADGNTLSDNRLERNGLGFLLDSANRNTLERNSAQGATAAAYMLAGRSSENLLRENSAGGGSGAGYRIEGAASQNTLTGNQASNNQDGFALERSSGNTLTGNQATRNTTGFLLSGATGNRLTGNRATENGFLGFGILNQADANTLAGNTAERNAVNGFSIEGSSRNALLRNTATRNGNGTSEAAGFQIESREGADANRNVLRSNRATNNDGTGFLLHGHGNPISGTTLDHNTANNNSQDGFATWRATGNTWTRNTATGNRARDFHTLAANDDTMTATASRSSPTAAGIPRAASRR